MYVWGFMASYSETEERHCFASSDGHSSTVLRCTCVAGLGLMDQPSSRTTDMGRCVPAAAAPSHLWTFPPQTLSTANIEGEKFPGLEPSPSLKRGVEGDGAYSASSSAAAALQNVRPPDEGRIRLRAKDHSSRDPGNAGVLISCCQGRECGGVGVWK